jgi:hypothetical protein
MKTNIGAWIAGGPLMACLVLTAAAATPKMDFNNDGLADLAIGSPFASVNGKFHAGSVTVLYGSYQSLTTPGSPPILPQLSTQKTQLWHKDLPSVPGDAKAGDEFGAALAAGDFNGDGYSDLAIGAPGGALGGGNEIGTVTVLYGSAGGLLGTRLCFQGPCTNPPNPVVLKMPAPHPGDRFGYALAAGRFNAGINEDLAVGAPNYDLGSVRSAGAVRVFYGSHTGLSEISSYLLSLNNLQGAPEIGDEFGRSLAAGNFDGGPGDTVDLAIGIPRKGQNDNGAVSVVYGTMSGLSPVQTLNGGGNKFWTQNMTNFPSGGSDRFGWALAAGKFSNGSADALAIGIPGRDVEGVSSAGAVMILRGQDTGLYGSSFGLMAGGSRLWTLASDGVLGAPAANDLFGEALAAADFGYDGSEDLAIGIPFRDSGSATHAGAVVVLYGSAGAGLTSANSQYRFMGNQVQQYDYFGRSLSAARFGGDSRADLAVGMPQLTGPGAVLVYFGSASGFGLMPNQHWTPDSPGVPGAASFGGKFGWGLSK